MLISSEHRSKQKRIAPSKIRLQQTRDRLAGAADHLLSVDKTFKQKLCISALQPGPRLLLYIAVNRSISIKDAIEDSTLSYRAFYNMLNSLKKKALIEVERDIHDKRVRRLVLGPEFRSIAKVISKL